MTNDKPMTCRDALLLLLDQVDFTASACSMTDMVGQCVPKGVFEKCRAAIAAEASVAVSETTTPQSHRRHDDPPHQIRTHQRAVHSESGLSYNPDDYDTRGEVPILRTPPSAGVQSANTSIMGYVLAVEDLSGSERAGYMRVYGPQYHTREQAERDAKLPMARGQRAEVWEVHAPTDSRTGEARGLDDARDAARWRKFNEVAKRHLDSYTGILRFFLPRDGLGYKTFEETIDSYIENPAGNRTNAESGQMQARATTPSREVGRTPTQSSAETANERDGAEGSSGLGDTARRDDGSPDAAARSALSRKTAIMLFVEIANRRLHEAEAFNLTENMRATIAEFAERLRLDA